MKKCLLTALLSITCLCPQMASAVSGKVDVGYMHMEADMIQNSQKTRQLNMDGVAANATVQLYSFLVTKPTVMFAEGEGNYYSLGNNIGAYIPVLECFSITPSLGGGYSCLRFDSGTEVFPGFNVAFRQKVISRSFNIATDFSYSLTEKIWLSTTVQYAWVNSYTTFGRLGSYRAESRGFNYLAMLDYFITDCIAINLTGAWQSSRDKERHGSDGRGLRVGMGYTF